MAAAAVAVVAPIVLTSYLGDDTWNSSIDGMLRNVHWTFWHWIAFWDWAWMTCCGRLTLLNMIEGYGIFHLIHGLLLYKTLQASSVIVNLATFYLLLRALRLSVGTSLLGVLIALLTLQFRVYSDPILGFAISYPTILEADLLSFLFFAWYCNSGLRRDFVLAVAFFLVALALYETSYPFSVVHVLIALRLGRKRPLLAAVPFLAASVAFAAAELLLRHSIHMAPNAVYSLDLRPGVYLRTLAQQMTGAIPLSYFTFYHGYLAARGAPVPGAPPSLLIGTGLVALAAAAAVLLRRGREIAAERGLLPIVAAGACLWIFSEVLVSAVPRYQQESSWGISYLPVYLAGFGFTLIATAAVATAMRLRAAAVAIAALFACLFSLTYATNASVIDVYAGERNARLLLTESIRDGLFARLSPGDRLFVDPHFSELFRHFGGFTDPSTFFADAGIVKLDVSPIDAVADKLCGGGSCLRPAEHAYAFAASAIDARTGYAALGRLAGARDLLERDPAHPDPLVTAAQLLLRGRDLNDAALAPGYAVQWESAGCGNVPRRREAVPLEALRTLRSGRDWRIVALDSRCGAIDLPSIAVYSRLW